MATNGPDDSRARWGTIGGENPNLLGCSHRKAKRIVPHLTYMYTKAIQSKPFLGVYV